MSDAVTVTREGRDYVGWKNISVSRSIDNVCGGFSMNTINDWYSGTSAIDMFIEDKIQIKIHGTPVINGYVDTVNTSLSKGGLTYALKGRDKTSLLIESMIAFVPPSEYRDWPSLIRILRIEENLSLNVILGFVSADVRSAKGDDLPKVKCAAGDTYFDVLARKARLDGLMLTTDANGNLNILFNQPIEGHRVIKEGANLKSVTVNHDNTNRYNNYYIFSQPETDLRSIDPKPYKIAHEEDLLGRTGKTFVAVDRNAADKDELALRAAWERSVRAAKSEKINCVVQGFYADQNNKEIWAPNQLVDIEIKSMNISGKFLITSLTYVYDNGGSNTSLTLERQGARDPNPITEKNRVRETWDDLRGVNDAQ